MPIYEYKCEHCGEKFDVLQKFNEAPLAECILCHAGPVKKLISVSSFVLKGAGFYVNDYKKGSASGSASSASSAKSKTGSESAAKTDSATSSAAAPKSDSAPQSETSKAA